VVREIENFPTEAGDKPKQEVKIVDCGELKGADYEKSIEKSIDPSGDQYEEFPEDQGTDIPGPEIVKIATDLKEIGNKSVKEKKWDVALTKYEKGLRYIQEYPEPQDTDSAEFGKELYAIKFVLNNNAALMQLNLKEYDGAVKSATSALAVPGISDDLRAKAFFRRGTGYVGKKNEDEALKDLEEAHKLVPTDSGIKNKLAEVKKVAQDRRKKEKAAYSKFFQ
jgi:peptidyl-prolyl isomerase D